MPMCTSRRPKVTFGCRRPSLPRRRRMHSRSSRMRKRSRRRTSRPVSGTRSVAPRTDSMLPLLGLRERLHPEFDVAFISNPDRSRADIPSHEQVRGAWDVVNAELWKGFEKMSWPDWLQRHSAVSEEDFAKDASRNRFAVLLSRTNHLSYHLGQAVLALRSARA